MGAGWIPSTVIQKIWIPPRVGGRGALSQNIYTLPFAELFWIEQNFKTIPFKLTIKRKYQTSSGANLELLLHLKYPGIISESKWMSHGTNLFSYNRLINLLMSSLASIEAVWGIRKYRVKVIKITKKKSMRSIPRLVGD